MTENGREIMEITMDMRTVVHGDYDSKRSRRGYDFPDERSSDSRNLRHDSLNYDDWKCFECLTWNYPDDRRCNRCGEYRPDEGDNQHYQKAERFYSGVVPADDETEVDEFGRAVKKPTEKRNAPEWPPCFDSAGSAFVFDARSGMFYEGISDFFYDPKSKLYYGNKKGMYYKYNSDMTPPFEPVQAVQSETAGKSSSMDPVPILDPSRPENGIEGSKKSIVIKLKTKSLKSTKSKSQAPSTEAPDTTVAITQLRVHKQHELDIDKWSDRQVEKRIEDRQFQRTAKGEPMCPLCRRKFPSVEKLLQHEKVSQLHKDNLAKAAQAKKEVPSQYVDRAEQRRSMYGPDVPALPNRELSTETAANSNEKTPIVDSLDNESNIGNQLLRKMGWKEGGAVGGRSEGLSAAAGLVKDWERIEQLAEQGGKDRSGRSGGGVGAL